MLDVLFGIVTIFAIAIVIVILLVFVLYILIANTADEDLKNWDDEWKL